MHPSKSYTFIVKVSAQIKPRTLLCACKKWEKKKLKTHFFLYQNCWGKPKGTKRTIYCPRRKLQRFVFPRNSMQPTVIALWQFTWLQQKWECDGYSGWQKGAIWSAIMQFTWEDLHRFWLYLVTLCTSLVVVFFFLVVHASQ